MPGDSLTTTLSFVRTMQIIVGAMVAGCVMFLVIVLVIPGGAGIALDTPLLTYIALAFAAAAVVARLVVPGIVVAQARRKILSGDWKVAARAPTAGSTASTGQDDDASKLAQVFMVRTIVAAAILEGAIFLSLIVCLLQRSTLTLGLAVVLLAALAAHFPTRAGVDRWLADQMRLLDEERQMR